MWSHSQSSISIARKYDLILRDSPVHDDHDYADVPNFEQVSEYKEAAINYIAGFGVKIMKRKVNCMVCTEALTAPNGKVHNFVALKDRGRLQKASPNVITVCLETEKCFQRLLKTSNGKLPQGGGISQAVASSVLSNCAGLKLFPELHEHQFDTAVDGNHGHYLVKLAASCYCKIKLFHIGKQMAASVTGPKVRKRMSKLILFSHQ